MKELVPEAREKLELCLDADRRSRGKWIKALCEYPELAGCCPHWNEFDNSDWLELLRCQLQFKNICPFHKFSVEDWQILLIYYVDFFEICPVADKFTVEQWFWLLRAHPELATHCLVLNDFPENSRAILCGMHPQLRNCWADY